MTRGKKVQISELSETPMEGLEQNLEIVDQAYPDIGTLKNTDAIIKVKSAAIGWVDLLMLSGQYQHQPPLPYTPGLEYCGEVIWLGTEVDRHAVAIGDHVIIDGFKSGPRSPGSYQKYGGFATYSVAPSEALIKLPDGLTLDQACNLLGSYETAYHCLIACGNIKAGEHVLIHGASGATGLAAVHIAKLKGAVVIATGRSDEKLHEVAKQGADHIINCTPSNENEQVKRFRNEVKEITGGKGVDLVYDGVGGAISEESLRCVSFGARFLIVGWAATPFVARGKGRRGAPNVNKLPTNLIMMKGLKVIGCPSVIAAQHDPSLRPQRLKQVMDWASSGKIAPHISRTYNLANIKDGLRAKWNSEFVGGAAVRPD